MRACWVRDRLLAITSSLLLRETWRGRETQCSIWCLLALKPDRIRRRENTHTYTRTYTHRMIKLLMLSLHCGLPAAFQMFLNAVLIWQPWCPFYPVAASFQSYTGGASRGTSGESGEEWSGDVCVCVCVCVCVWRGGS